MPDHPYPCGDEVDLFRTFYSAVLAVVLVLRLRHHLRFIAARGATVRPPRFLGVVAIPRLGQLGAGAVAGLLIASLIASAATSSKTALAIAAVSSLLYFAQVVHLPEIRRKANTVPVILTLLAVSASSREGTPAWIACAPLVVIQLVVVQIYLSAGLLKLRIAGWQWADGRTLRSLLVRYHLRDSNRAALALASRQNACRVAALSILLFELTFWLVVPFPVLTAPYLLAAVGFHVATAMLMRIHYWLFLGPAYLVFLLPLLRQAGMVVHR